MPLPPGGGSGLGPLNAARRPGEAVGSVLGHEHDLEAPVTAVVALDSGLAFATGAGTVLRATSRLDAATAREAHRGAVLSAAAAGSKLFTGGDDGRVVLTHDDGSVEAVWTHPLRRWIDHVAASPDGALAWASGKTVFVRRGSVVSELELPASAAGLAFAPKSNRLAVSHYGGATVWDLDGDTTQAFEWKGAHLDVLWSTDERYLITAMQEGAVHGWRTADGSDFAMRGYPAKPRSLSFSRTGDWLATSGAFEVVIWPFVGKGPMGKTPEQLARRTHLVTAVAYHPLNSYVAAGYDDGVVLLARQEDRRELMVRKKGNGPVTGLAWAASGKQLAYGTDDGMAGLVDFSGVDAAKKP
ncbi:MAG: WD40 repeat domain-containing protein [Hyphomicrobiaceae bacterium]|nr:WD40 repeat domain-containing protein [Hyphomicrobiaceae bacterium]